MLDVIADKTNCEFNEKTSMTEQSKDSNLERKSQRADVSESRNLLFE
jgi:hypothetical protein